MGNPAIVNLVDSFQRSATAGTVTQRNLAGLTYEKAYVYAYLVGVTFLPGQPITLRWSLNSGLTIIKPGSLTLTVSYQGVPVYTGPAAFLPNEDQEVTIPAGNL